MKNRWTIVAIFAIFFLPLALAWWLYSEDYRPKIDVEGTLYQPARLVPHNLGIHKADGEEFSFTAENKWVLLQAVPPVCDDACLANIRLLRAVHTRLQKHAWRLKHIGWQFTSSNPVPSEAAFNTIQTPEPEKMRQWLQSPENPDATVWLIDPRGYAILSYAYPLQPAKVLDDLKTLLKSGN